MPAHFLSWITFTPLIGMLAVLATPRRSMVWIRGLSLAATLVSLVLATLLYFGAFHADTAGYQLVERADWIRAIHTEYFVGIDGLSRAFVWLSTLLLFIAVAASSSVARAGKTYYALLLLLEVGVLGAFVSLDLFLFFVFFELIVLPMWFLIGGFGGTRRENAAMKFVLYAVAGSALMLIAIVALRLDGGTFSLPMLAELARSGKLSGQNLAGEGALLGMNFTVWCFWFLVVGFAIKLPLLPLHAWFSDAFAAAPTPIALILAAVVSKLGAFGLLRVCFPLLPDASREFAFALAVLGAISILHGALVSLARMDLKRLVAHCLISQMGFVLLGSAAMSGWRVRGTAEQSCTMLFALIGLATTLWTLKQVCFASVEDVGARDRAVERTLLALCVLLGAIPLLFLEPLRSGIVQIFPVLSGS